MNKCKGVKMEKERKSAVNVLLPNSFIDKLDEERGQIARSELLRDFILKNYKFGKLKAV